MSQLDQNRHRLQEAQSALDSLTAEPHVIDAEYIDEYKKFTAAADEARRQYDDRWRELFE